jgi:hypothetical protein
MLLARNFGCLVAITRVTPAARIRNKSIRKRGLMKILIMVLTITFREGYEIHRERGKGFYIHGFPILPRNFVSKSYELFLN